ncbi:MFS transporter [Pseudomonas sp. L13]|uniref:MFS transporter n=1 Tax=Pseudomonas sp. L13 TaxID=343985 RepID=UPI001379E581|nr:MFS transporter [Pseudomonas sp. L13]
MMAQLGVTLYLPAMPVIVEVLNISETAGYNSLLMYLGGAAVPLVFAARVIRIFGRSAVLLTFCCTFLSASILSVWTCCDTGFYVSRTLQGVGGGGAALIGRALLSEIFSGARLAKHLSLLSYAFVFALIVGQVAGGYLVLFGRWEVLSLVMALVSVITIFLVLTMRGALSALDSSSRQRTSGTDYVFIVRQRAFYLPVLLAGCGYGVFVVCQGVGVYVFDLLWGWGSSEYGVLGIWLGIAYFFGALSVRIALKSISINALSVIGVMVLLAAVTAFLLSTLHYLERYFVVVAYVAVWYAQALIYPCVASMAVKKYPGIESMMLFSFLQQLVALFFGTLASLVMPGGMHAVALLTLGLGGMGAVVVVLLSLKRN